MQPTPQHAKQPSARRRWLICAVIVAAVALLAAAGWLILSRFRDKEEVPSSADPIHPAVEPATEAPAAVLGAFWSPADKESAERVEAVIGRVYEAGGNALFVPADSQGLSDLVAKAHEKALLVFLTADPLADPAGGQFDLGTEESARRAGSRLADLCARCDADGVALQPALPEKGNPSYADYAGQGGSADYEAFQENAVDRFLRAVAREIRTAGGGVCVGGVLPDSRPDRGAEWAAKGGVDFLVVTADTAMPDFAGVASAWQDRLGETLPLYYRMPEPGDAVSAAELADRCHALLDTGQRGLLFGSPDTLGSEEPALAKVWERLRSLDEESYGIRELSIQSPSSTEFTTYVPSVSFVGASDPTAPLTLNGQTVEQSDTGYFSLTCPLTEGENRFVFTHKGATKTYTVTYRKVIIRSLYPSEETFVDGGAQVTVGVVALAGSTLKARLGDQVVPMTGGAPASADSNEKFAAYTATFTMPPADVVPVEAGTLIVTAVRDGETETKSGGRLVVRAGQSGGNVVSGPASEAYESGYGIRVGEGDRYVAEVTKYQTETLDIITPTDERSRPTNAYLPQGTVDYCSDADTVFYNPESGNTNAFRDLAYGKRVYSDDNIKIFKARLPETNTVTAVSSGDDGRHTTITFDVAWKAPFQVTLAPQSYRDPYPKSGRPHYDVTETTYTYVELEFCYTVSGQGKVDVSFSPVFRSAEWVKTASGNYALRLWLKTPGRFYGWAASYNADNQLVFSFLDPYQAKPADNAFGVSLEGAVIVLDAGHGGEDPGAVGSSKQYTEAVLNLILARKIQRQLEELGATVIMTRTEDTEVLLDDRARLTMETKPDLFLSIHRNASTSSSARGYQNFYFYPFSKALGDAVSNTAGSLFSEVREVEWYPYYVCRVSCCPAILTENGFMTNRDDLEWIKTDNANNQCATATVAGIVDYFASIRETGE